MPSTYGYTHWPSLSALHLWLGGRYRFHGEDLVRWVVRTKGCDAGRCECVLAALYKAGLVVPYGEANPSPAQAFTGSDLIGPPRTLPSRFWYRVDKAELEYRKYAAYMASQGFEVIV